MRVFTPICLGDPISPTIVNEILRRVNRLGVVKDLSSPSGS